MKGFPGPENLPFMPSVECKKTRRHSWKRFLAFRKTLEPHRAVTGFVGLQSHTGGHQGPLCAQPRA